ncbi:hypothetical protein BSY240_4600 (plasmid) [Agrobacterium sp. RAC06]|nr:hypothetical protein BSY240_4600 [Agrobacterium sp. RAC06]
MPVSFRTRSAKRATCFTSVLVGAMIEILFEDTVRAYRRFKGKSMVLAQMPARFRPSVSD